MRFLEFIKLAHCDGDMPSSKRLWGAVMISASQICIIIASILSFVAGTGITETLKDLIEIDIIIGASLLGLQTLVSGILPKTKNKS